MIILGIDAGGSRSEGVVTDGDLQELGRARGGPGWAGDLAQAVASLRALGERLAAYGRPDHVVIGAAGAADAAIAGTMAEQLGDLAGSVRVTTDLEITLVGAFGATNPGIVLVAGTGSAAVARLPDGTVVRAGGRGPRAGDEGSAYWLGKRALGAGLITGLGTSRPAVAALAPVVCRLAESGDVRAGGFVDEGADHLVGLVRELAARVPDAHVALAGGLLSEESAMRRAVLGRLRGFTVLSEAPDPAMGAARLALTR